MIEGLRLQGARLPPGTSASVTARGRIMVTGVPHLQENAHPPRTPLGP
jgi:hypothetical protein